METEGRQHTSCRVTPTVVVKLEPQKGTWQRLIGAERITASFHETATRARAPEVDVAVVPNACRHAKLAGARARKDLER